MGVVSALKRRFDSEPPPQFECKLCATQFDYEPMNCPTCGTTELRQL